MGEVPANLNGPGVFSLKDMASKHAKRYLQNGVVSLRQKNTHGRMSATLVFEIM